MALSDDMKEYYRASPMRGSVLCWYPFTRGARALDLSGGALTGLLEKRCGIVTSGNVSSIEGQFDYVVVMDPDDFSVDILSALRSRLVPHGRLLISYENPFALRFWAGKRAPNTGMPYDTLFGRGASPLPSKAEMQKRLSLAGFDGQKWYYPLTDHWFTMEVYSENYLPNEHLNQRFVPYIDDDVYLKFDERNLYREVIRGGAFEFMCGAYLVEARVSVRDFPCPVDYVAVTAYREPAKRFATIVRSDGIVYKTPLHPDGKMSVSKIHQNHEELADLGVDVIKTCIEDDSLVMPRMNLPTLWDYWASKLVHGIFDEKEMISQFDRIHESIDKSGVNGKCWWELVPANCFFDKENNRIIFFDQEHCWEDVSPDFALVRAIKSFNYTSVFREEPRSAGWIESLKNRYGLSDKWDKIVGAMEPRALSEAFGPEYIKYRAMNGRIAKQIKDRNAKLIAEGDQEAKRYDRFCAIIQRMRELGIEKPVVYGYGRRGKTLRNVFDDYGVNGVIFLDKMSKKYRSLDDLPAGMDFDAVIVSILKGESVLSELREKTNLPVYTLGELIGESVE